MWTEFCLIPVLLGLWVFWISQNHHFFEVVILSFLEVCWVICVLTNYNCLFLYVSPVLSVDNLPGTCLSYFRGLLSLPGAFLHPGSLVCLDIVGSRVGSLFLHVVGVVLSFTLSSGLRELTVPFWILFLLCFQTLFLTDYPSSWIGSPPLFFVKFWQYPKVVQFTFLLNTLTCFSNKQVFLIG